MSSMFGAWVLSACIADVRKHAESGRFAHVYLDWVLPLCFCLCLPEPAAGMVTLNVNFTQLKHL